MSEAYKGVLQMSDTPCAIALGFFDGVHIAHQKIIKSVVDYAEKNNLRPIVLSFDRSPSEILSPDKVSYITTIREKERLINALGAKAEFIPVSKEFLDMSAEDFITEILVKKYNVKYAVCGYNYRFGKGGKGNTRLLTDYGKRMGFFTHVHECEFYDVESVSSSRIRELIRKGEILLANKLLGKSFAVEGTICEGKHLGRTIGFPTANMFFEEAVVIPKKGVYKTLVTVNNQAYKAITNTGVNPTVGGEKLRTETYIPRFEGDIYNQKMKIEFLGFIREERKFESIAKLKKQIAEDIKKL